MASTRDIKANQEKHSRRRDVFLFSHPRTASNLFCHLVANQPGWIHAKYHFANAFDATREGLDQGSLPAMAPEQRQELNKLMSQGLDRLYHDREIAVAEDKSLFVKNHVTHIWKHSGLWARIWGEEHADGSAPELGTNPTVLPYNFLRSWLPIVLIRHPALVIESWYRAETRVKSIELSDKSWELYTTFCYSRQLYEWLLSQSKTQVHGEDPAYEPIVVDADDIVQDDKTIKALCELCGMDPSLVRSDWDKIPPEQILSSRHESYMTGFWNSTSVDRSKSSKGISMDIKHDEWEAEFGLAVAKQLSVLVTGALPDYQYLRSRKW